MSDWLVVPLSGEQSLPQATRLRERLLELIGETALRVVILDLTAVTFIDSTTIGVIIGARKRLSTQGRHLWLAAPTEPVLRTLNVIALDKLMPVFLTLAEAQQAVGEIEAGAHKE
jgi:anti-sigma B factor antagonist